MLNDSSICERKDIKIFAKLATPTEESIPYVETDTSEVGLSWREYNLAQVLILKVKYMRLMKLILSWLIRICLIMSQNQRIYYKLE